MSRLRRMHDDSAQRAIKAALSGHWDEAVEFNLQVLKSDPTDIDTLNRLARAYAAIGQTKNAAKTWHKVLRLDSYNSIANSQLAKHKYRRETTTSDRSPLSANTFLDEPGKTKTVSLCRLANTAVLLNLEPGQPLNLVSKKRQLEVATLDDHYLGSLPDDLSHHLIKLINAGNKYNVLVKKVSRNHIQVFLKETKRAKRYSHTPSFSSVINNLNEIELPPISEVPLDTTVTGEDF